jgi:hypothetical protein
MCKIRNNAHPKFQKEKKLSDKPSSSSGKIAHPNEVPVAFHFPSELSDHDDFFQFL